MKLIKTEEIAIISENNQATLIDVLRPVGRRFLRKTNHRYIRRIARSIDAVSRPTSRIYLQNYPTHMHPGAQDCKSITILSANLWHDWPLQRRLNQRLEIFANLAESVRADIILVQEVARTSKLNADQWLADRLRMSHLYTRANGDQATGFEEGLAILSRYPLIQPFARQLSTSPVPFVRRMALGVEVGTPCGSMLVLSVHLGIFNKQNMIQHDELQNWVNNIPGDKPILIGGDFNAQENSSQIKKTRVSWLDTFRYLHPHADGTTHELRLPCGKALARTRRDYIFLRNPQRSWRILETRHLQPEGAYLSDHQVVLTKLQPYLD